MKIDQLTFHPYEIALTSGQRRRGLWVKIIDTQGKSGWGEIAPLPKWSRETLDQAYAQIQQVQNHIVAIEWELQTCLGEIERLALLPSVTFGLESALLSILDPLPAFNKEASALLMGSYQEILEQAKQRSQEGFTSAKLKVSQLSFQEAAEAIDLLKEHFHLRIDVNRAWSTQEALRFFAQFPLNTFDYVEEPFQDHKDLLLGEFQHPLAIDESFPHELSFRELEGLNTLKAIIYKPTIQGGLIGCLPVHRWAKEHGVDVVLSSSFESALGLAHVASIAQRLSINTPIGIGTYHYLKDHEGAMAMPFKIDKGWVRFSECVA